jgi:hypothetical protein
MTARRRDVDDRLDRASDTATRSTHALLSPVSPYRVMAGKIIPDLADQLSVAETHPANLAHQSHGDHRSLLPQK